MSIFEYHRSQYVPTARTALLAVFGWGLGLSTGMSGCAMPEESPSARPVRVAPGPEAEVRELPAREIFIARHGRTVMNRLSQIGGQIEHDGLDPLGYKQRVGLYLLLRHEPIAAIFVSALLRSRQSAEPLAAHFKLTPIVSPELNEFRGGVSEGVCYTALGKRPRSEAAAACDQPSRDPLVKRAEAFLARENQRRYQVGLAYRWPGGGESIPDVDRRLKRFLGRFPKAFRDKSVLIVGHSGTNRFLLARLMGWPLVNAARLRQGHTQVFRLVRRARGQTPSLSAYLNGKWVACAQPPTLHEGLPCLSRAANEPGGPVKPPAKPGPDAMAPPDAPVPASGKGSGAAPVRPGRPVMAPARAPVMAPARAPVVAPSGTP